MSEMNGANDGGVQFDTFQNPKFLASAPKPTAWCRMLLGFPGDGAGLRAARRGTIAA